MGLHVRINGEPVEVSSYRITESSMPLAGGDSSGAVGTIEVTMQPKLDRVTGVKRFPLLYLEKPLSFVDTSRGSTLGTVRMVDDNRVSDVPWTLTADTRLGDFNIEATVQPYTGTLEGAFEYYCSIANIDSAVFVDPSIAFRPVSFLGWTGNLWVRMKELATAIGADLNLISNNIILRPVRLFEAAPDHNIESSVSGSGTELALKQEVIWYDTQHTTSGLIYPPTGMPERSPLSVSAGETVETRLTTNASIISVDQPVAMASVAPDHSTSSVYTIVGDDNIVIQPSQWEAFGGSLRVAVSDDSRDLIVTLTGATGLRQINGTPMRTFRVALSAGTSDSTYPTLRIVGNAVMKNQKSLIIPTGVDPWRTGQEFAPTIDNEFLNNLSDAYSAGVRGARRHAGRNVSLSASVTLVNRRDQTGTVNIPTYGDAQGFWGMLTYGNVKTVNAGLTYGQVEAALYERVEDNFDSQVFGNVVGARVYDRDVARWFRVRDATTEWGQMSVECDDDLLHGDVQTRFDALTYGQVKTHFTGRSYFEANLMGLAA